MTQHDRSTRAVRSVLVENYYNANDCTSTTAVRPYYYLYTIARDHIL